MIPATTIQFTDEYHECPDCGDGPRWHNDPSGCTRMNASWCGCSRVYACNVDDDPAAWACEGAS